MRYLRKLRVYKAGSDTLAALSDPSNTHAAWKHRQPLPANQYTDERAEGIKDAERFAEGRLMSDENNYYYFRSSYIYKLTNTLDNGLSQVRTMEAHLDATKAIALAADSFIFGQQNSAMPPYDTLLLGAGYFLFSLCTNDFDSGYGDGLSFELVADILKCL